MKKPTKPVPTKRARASGDALLEAATRRQVALTSRRPAPKSPALRALTATVEATLDRLGIKDPAKRAEHVHAALARSGRRVERAFARDVALAVAKAKRAR